MSMASVTRIVKQLVIFNNILVLSTQLQHNATAVTLTVTTISFAANHH
jgi:hypothetical protein